MQKMLKQRKRALKPKGSADDTKCRNDSRGNTNFILHGTALSYTGKRFLIPCAHKKRVSVPLIRLLHYSVGRAMRYHDGSTTQKNGQLRKKNPAPT